MECKEKGCLRPAKTRGWCGAHYARHQRGKPMDAPLRATSVVGRPCSVEGCTKPGTRSSDGKPMCSRHKMADWRIRQWQCAEPDCVKLGTHGRGLCPKHYAQSVRVADERPRCSLDGCEQPAISRTYCVMHYQRWAKYGEPGEATARKAAAYKATDLCGVRGCERRAQSKGYCNTHRRRLARFGLAHDELETMLRKQGGKCAICRARKPGTSSGEWCVDHDHVTGQVRGLLCGKCNSGIGFLKDDPEVIRAALQYVIKHRQMELFQRKAG